MTSKKSTRRPSAPNTAYLPACGDLGDKEKKLKGAPVESAAGGNGHQPSLIHSQAPEGTPLVRVSRRLLYLAEIAPADHTGPKQQLEPRRVRTIHVRCNASLRFHAAAEYRCPPIGTIVPQSRPSCAAAPGRLLPRSSDECSTQRPRCSQAASSENEDRRQHAEHGGHPVRRFVFHNFTSHGSLHDQHPSWESDASLPEMRQRSVHPSRESEPRVGDLLRRLRGGRYSESLRSTSSARRGKAPCDRSAARVFSEVGKPARRGHRVGAVEAEHPAKRRGAPLLALPTAGFARLLVEVVLELRPADGDCQQRRYKEADGHGDEEVGEAGHGSGTPDGMDFLSLGRSVLQPRARKLVQEFGRRQSSVGSRKLRQQINRWALPPPSRRQLPQVGGTSPRLLG